jgi:acetylornithine deacetylase/succinyl-diaminopimelate desuccinylase-like protein
MTDGCIWGRGAIDMKAMNAMILANIRQLAKQGHRPRRTLVLAFFADEEALSVLGSHWVVDHRPEYFEGVSEAITEVGGFSVNIPTSRGSQRVYLLQTAEKGTLWLRLRASGRAGHGSVPNPESAVGRLADAISRINHHEFPLHYLESVRALMTGLAEISGAQWSHESPEELTPLLGSSRPFVDASMRDTVNATIVSGGYLNNVVPQNADAWLDCRFLPGHEETLLETITQLAGEHVEVTVHRRDVALEEPFQVPLVDQMRQSLLAEDPGARVLPYCLAAGTDNKALSRLGIRGYGFAPMKLPPELDFASLFHGVDERVPVSSVAFGARVLHNLLADC